MTDGEILTNTDFEFEFGGQKYTLKRASLRQVMEWQRQSVEINKVNDGTTDLKLAAKAIYLALQTVDKNITEDDVLDKTPGDIDVIATLQLLGFMSQQKVGAMQKLRDALANPPSGGRPLAQ